LSAGGCEQHGFSYAIDVSRFESSHRGSSRLEPQPTTLRKADRAALFSPGYSPGTVGTCFLQRSIVPSMSNHAMFSPLFMLKPASLERFQKGPARWIAAGFVRRSATGFLISHLCHARASRARLRLRQRQTGKAQSPVTRSFADLITRLSLEIDPSAFEASGARKRDFSSAPPFSKPISSQDSSNLTTSGAEFLCLFFQRGLVSWSRQYGGAHGGAPTP